MNQSPLKFDQNLNRSNFKPILYSLLILFSGIIIGVGLTLIITDISDVPKSLPPGPEYISNKMVKRIARELRLSPEQHELLGPIVQKHMKAMDDIRKQARPQITEELDQMNEEILSILNEPQQKIWKDRIQRMEDHFTRMRQRRTSGRNRRNEGRRHLRPQPHKQFPDGQLPLEGEPPIEDIAAPPPAR